MLVIDPGIALLDGSHLFIGDHPVLPNEDNFPLLFGLTGLTAVHQSSLS